MFWILSTLPLNCDYTILRNSQVLLQQFTPIWRCQKCQSNCWGFRSMKSVSSLPHDAGSLLSAGVHSLRLYRTTRGRCCRPVSIVCLSVCRVYALYPEDRLKISSNFFLGPVVPSFYFLTPSADTQFQVSMGVKYTGGENLHFSTEITVYLGNDAR